MPVGKPKSPRRTRKYGATALTPRRSRRLSGLSPTKTSPTRRQIQRPASSVDRKKSWDHLDRLHETENETKTQSVEDEPETASENESKTDEAAEKAAQDSSAAAGWSHLAMTNVDFKVLGALFLVFDLYLVSFLRVGGFIDLDVPGLGIDSGYHPYTTTFLATVLFVICNVVTQPWLKSLASQNVSVGSEDAAIVSEISQLGWHVVHSIGILGLLGDYFVGGSSIADMPAVFGALAIGFYTAQCLSNCWRDAGGARNWMTLAFVLAFAKWGKTVDVVLCLVIKCFLSLAMAKWCQPVGSNKWLYYDLCLTIVALHVAAWGSCEQAILDCVAGGQQELPGGEEEASVQTSE